MKKWTPVLVEWMDAYGGDTGWEEPTGKIHKPEKVRSVGFLFRQDQMGVSIHMSRSGGHVGGYLFVPAVNVVSVRELS